MKSLLLGGLLNLLNDEQTEAMEKARRGRR